LHHILLNVDRRQALNFNVRPVDASLPEDEVLQPYCDSEPPRPRVLWSTFGWPVTNAWPDPDEPDNERPQNVALFFQAMDVDLCELGIFYLGRGFFNQTVAVVDWDIFKEEQKIAEGTFSVGGLDNDSVRVTLVRFPECRLADDDPPKAPLLCPVPDPPPTDPNDPYNMNPWYDEGVGCRFEVTSLGIHVDLQAVTDPFSFSMEFIAEFSDVTEVVPAVVTEVQGLMIGREDGTVDVTGTYNGQPVTMVFDFDTGEMTFELTGEPKKDCTFDTETAEIEECV
jgi:hypothetical protein